MKNKIRRIVSLLLVFVLLIIGVPIAVKAQTYAVGDIIEFGLYPQSEVTDDMLKTVLVEQEINDKGDLIYNGKKYRRYNYNNVTHFFVFEPIEWKIMSNNADGLYVISKKILNIQQYNTTNCSITWENCSLRTWLNDTFYSDAFSEDEKKMITYRETENKKNPIFGTEGGNNTWDKVFIPSIYDASNSTYGFSTHYNVDSNRMAHRTRYASAIVGSTSESTDSWWLRTPGAQDNTACSVSSSGYISTTNTVYSKDREVTYYFGIRPAIYLDDYDKYEGPQTKPEDTNTKKEYKTGDLIEFGSYPQSEVTNEELKAALATQSIDSNGDVLYGGQKYRRVVLSNTSHFYLYEPIEWQVLNCGNDRLFVVSKNVLSNQKYNSINEDVSWENCTLRTWLNDLFYNEAFSDTEKNAIKNVKLLNDNNPVYGTDAGNDTWDDVFILSIYDVSNANYGFVADYNASTTRVAYTTSYASAIIGSTSKSASTWWLRSPGQQANRACSISNTGYISTSNYVYSHDREVTYTFGIRPAVYLDVEAYNSSDSGDNVCTDGHDWELSSDFDVNCFKCKSCGELQPISPVLGYTIGKDSFSFPHEDVKSYSISNAWEHHVNPLLQIAFVSLALNGIDRLFSGFEWEGSCFGVATMNSSFFTNLPTSSYGKDSVFELSVVNADQPFGRIGNNDTKLKDSINIMQFSQCYLPISVFQSLSDLSINVPEKLVNTAKNIKPGDYPPVVVFNADFDNDDKSDCHAVSIIGILPDDFNDDCYFIAAYDCNTPSFPGLFIVDKEYKSIKYFYKHPKSKEQIELKVTNVQYYITSDNYNIDFFAPGLRDCNWWCYKTTSINRVGNSVVQSNDDFSSDYVNENYINYALFSDSELTLTDASGGYFTILNGEIVSTNLDAVYVIPVLGTNLTRVTVPYNGLEYTVTSDDDYYIHINYNHKNTALYCENGGELKGVLSETIQFVPKSNESTYDISYYAADLFRNSDVIGCTFNGTGSNFTANLTSDGIIVEDTDFKSLGFSVRYDDEGYTVEDIVLEKDSAIQNITIDYADNEIILEYEKEASVPENPTDPEVPTDPEIPTEPNIPEEPTEGNTNCSCLCHSKNSFMQFIYTIIRFIWQLFGMNMDCACGAKHFDAYFFG